MAAAVGRHHGSRKSHGGEQFFVVVLVVFVDKFLFILENIQLELLVFYAPPVVNRYSFMSVITLNR